VLRFWWRALAWSRYGGDLQKIKRKEDALFGSTGTGQSLVLMRLVQPSGLAEIKPPTVLKSSSNRVVGEGARYLGYGVMEAFASSTKSTQAGQLTRACLHAPVEFTVQLRTRNLDQESLDSLTNALLAMGTLGGMGAKSRKGYGSLVLRSLRSNGADMWSAPGTVDELKTAIAALRPSGMSDALPEFTALSKGTRHVLLSADGRESIDLLDLVGRELVRFRSWGRNGKILGGGVDSEKLFKDDHDLMKEQAGNRAAHPRRIAFGLPHNYGKPKNQQVGPHHADLDRRASPLFIHIHECGETPVAVVSFLPARFLPGGKSDISVGGKEIAQAPEVDLYRPIHAFLDRLLDAKQRQEPFTSTVEVKP
jgi:CRISPR-associated protein Cmr1